MHSYEYLIFLDRNMSTPLIGYITILSPIKDKVATNKKYFGFRLLTEEKLERTVWFSPEKQKLLAAIEEENDRCEIKRFKREQ